MLHQRVGVTLTWQFLIGAQPCSLASACAPPTGADVADNTVEPGVHCIRVAKRGEAAPGFQQHFLHQIFGAIGITGQVGAETL